MCMGIYAKSINLGGIIQWMSKTIDFTVENTKLFELGCTAELIITKLELIPPSLVEFETLLTTLLSVTYNVACYSHYIWVRKNLLLVFEWDYRSQVTCSYPEHADTTSTIETWSIFEIRKNDKSAESRTNNRFIIVAVIKYQSIRPLYHQAT